MDGTECTVGQRRGHPGGPDGGPAGGDRLEPEHGFDLSHPHGGLYRAGLDKAACQAQARDSFLRQVYQGAAGDLVAAFLREKPISSQEREELRRLLDEMEV